MALLSTIVIAVGAGIAPATLNYENVLRNREYTKSVSIFALGYLEQPEPQITLSGETKDWFSYELKSVDQYAEDKWKFMYDLTLRVPRKTRIRNYTGTITGKNCPPNSGGIGICVGATGNINVVPTKEKIIDGEVGAILTQDTYHGNPLCIRHSLGCYGNVKCKFKVIVDTGFGSFRKVYKMDAWTSDQSAQTCHNIDDVEPGSYRANTKVYLRDGKKWELIGENDPYFRIFEECPGSWCE